MTTLTHTPTTQRYALIVEALQAQFGAKLKTAALFGSQARGESHKDSDHDILVVIDGLPLEPLARNRAVRRVLLPILHELPGSISFVAKTPREIDANLTPLLLDVFVDGVCLHGRDYFESYRQKALDALAQSGLERRQVGGTMMWLFPRLPQSAWALNWEGFRESAG